MKPRIMSHDAARREFLSASIQARPISIEDEDDIEFQAAMEQYKRRSGRQFPTWSEILEVLRSIGYAKRIWKPVDAWSPLTLVATSPDHPPDASPDMAGWYARVETPA